MDWFFLFNFNELLFEWDENKNHINFQKHGLYFQTAAKVFRDSHCLIYIDEKHTEEERFIVIGKVVDVILVVCTVRGEHRIRLISARKATEAEKERYYEDLYENE